MRTTLLSILFCAFAAVSISAQTTAFTYQGSMQSSGSPANGNYDFEFKLFDLVSGGAQQGSTLQRLNVAVANGGFTVSLDFGAGTLPGADRFLDIALRTSGGGVFTALSPRQKVNSVPYAVRSLNAATADSVAAGGIPGGSGNYIQNSTTTQASSNFNINGNGTAGGTLRGDIIRADTSFNIGPTPFISIAGILNTFVGLFSGDANTVGTNNSFFGRSAGTENTSGSSNSFFGYAAGFANTTGPRNSFFGRSAGEANTVGADNTFVGYQAGQSTNSPDVGNENSFFGSSSGSSNTTGHENGFFGFESGFNNTTGSYNSFFGEASGKANTTGSFNAFYGRYSGLASNGDTNSFFGVNAGAGNTTGESNTFVGYSSGFGNNTGGYNTAVGYSTGVGSTGTFNTIVGYGANVGSGALTYATAIGSFATVSSSNTIALGRSDGSDTVRVPGNLVVINLGSAGSQPLCRNLSLQISTCSSSLRYKTNIGRFGPGISFVNQLRPISFDWKDGGMKDVGFGAEDIAKIDPRFVTFNSAGEVEGVKYDRIGVVLVNAVKEQQEQIEKQQTLIEKQQSMIEQLAKRLEQLEKKENK